MAETLRDTTNAAGNVELNEKTLRFYAECKEEGMKLHTPLYNKLPRYYNMYRGTYDGRPTPYRNIVHIPFTLAVIQSDVARKAQVAFNSWPVVEFRGLALGDSGNARRNTILVSQQMKDCNSFMKGVDFFVAADLYGTAIARTGWTFKQRKEKWRDVQSILGRGVEIVREGMVTRFDGPDWQNVDLMDFMVSPGAKDFDDARWCMHRYFLDLDEIEDLAADGTFDSSEVAKLKAYGDAAMSRDEYQNRWRVYRSPLEYYSRPQDKYQKPMMLVDFFAFVPKELAPDGVTFRMITIADDRCILRNVPMPFWHGKFPFLKYCPMPDPHFFYGIGKAEVMYRMQYISNKWASQKADIYDLSIDPTVLVSALSGINTDFIISRAGKVIKADGPVGDDMIRPMPVDLKGTQLADVGIAQNWGWMQLGAGAIEDVFLGGAGRANDRQTLGEFQGRQELVLTRNALESLLAEQGFICPLADQFHLNNRQYLKLPHLMKIMGNTAIINPITGLPLPPEPILINHDDVNNDYRCQAVGASQILSRTVRQAQAATLTQLAQNNPVAIQVINWVAFFKEVFKIFGWENQDELFLTDIPLINAMATQAGTSPAGVAGAAGSAMAGSASPPEMATLGGSEGGESSGAY